tara:strand:- start:9 stop:569 length:561 start_codon:yes stop_codon:yes gene_type:complete
MKLLLEQWRGYVNEVATELETRNINVKAGDWIIRAMTRAGEEYVVKQAKFPTLYNPEPVGEGPEGFQVYNVKPDDRTGIVITPQLAESLQREFVGEAVPQAEFHARMLDKSVPKITVRKQSQTFAKQAKGGEIIETHTEQSGNTILMFETPWGGTMPIKLNDVLIINDQEVYRIAKAEFDQTYQPI